ncbi:uncharacterized protein BcabD6B2_30060 [Babesia caballi]|uniref:Mic1 domain-containing protein n=1 Tax=Babesia caballi TaxID=5871 RepID=A0AAV4LTR9_BABCB|nr:hypothetical protein, conserved [Babesia caballi]
MVMHVLQEVRLVPNVELSTKNDLQFQKSAISVATIYNETYCIHKDPANGTISLRSLINSKAYDIVLELRCQATYRVAHRANNPKLRSLHPQRRRRLLRRVRVQPHRRPQHADARAFAVVRGRLRGGLLPATSRRGAARHGHRHCRDRKQVGQARCRTSVSRARTDKLLALFFTIVVPYAKTLMEMNKVGTKTANSVAIPFNLVEEYVGERSIVTEYRFAKTILYAHVANEWRLKPGENIFDAAIALLCHHKQFDHDALLKVRDEMDIQSGFVNNFILKSKLTSGTRDEVSPDFRDYLVPHEAGVPELHSPSVQSRPHIITVMLCYFKALMAHHLQPTHLLQILLFDVCVLYNNVSLALHLQSASVIRDSTYVCYRMLCLYLVVRDPAIRQQCLDMALRLRLHDICVMLSVYDREYLDALVFLRAHRVSAYPLHRVLYRAAGDVEAQERKPHLWPSLLAFIRCWVEESAADAKACPPPNLKDCDMWLPNL